MIDPWDLPEGQTQSAVIGDPASDGVVEALAAAILPAHPHTRGLVWQALREVVLAEREACAKIAEGCVAAAPTPEWRAAQHHIAAEIRARGED